MASQVPIEFMDFKQRRFNIIAISIQPPFLLLLTFNSQAVIALLSHQLLTLQNLKHFKAFWYSC